MDSDTIEKILQFIEKVGKVVCTQEIRTMKVKEIEKMLNDTKSQEADCLNMICAIFENKMSIINRGNPEKMATEIANLQSFHSKECVPLDEVRKIFNEKVEIIQDLSKYLPLEKKCYGLLYMSLVNLNGLKKKFDEYESESRISNDTLKDLFHISSTLDTVDLNSLRMYYPYLLCGLQKSKGDYVMVKNKEKVIVSVVNKFTEIKQELHNLANQIMTKLWQL